MPAAARPRVRYEWGLRPMRVGAALPEGGALCTVRLVGDLGVKLHERYAIGL